MADESHDLSEARDGTIELVSAYVSNANTNVSAEELQALIRETFATLSNLNSSVVPPAMEEKPKLKTRTEVSRSIRENDLISFEDGKPYKSLKRHLSLRGLSPVEYREKHGLPSDYPMTHPAYSARRSELAKSFGLGQKGRSAKAAPPKKRTKKSQPVD